MCWTPPKAFWIPETIRHRNWYPASFVDVSRRCGSKSRVSNFAIIRPQVSHIFYVCHHD